MEPQLKPAIIIIQSTRVNDYDQSIKCKCTNKQQYTYTACIVVSTAGTPGLCVCILDCFVLLCK